ncbi:hypothetical protein V3C99_012802 [Haemonchus contortus]
MSLFYIRLAYCIPSIVLYIVVIYAISKEKQRLFGSFYSLLVIQAITNLLVYVNSFYFLQLANETEDYRWWAVIYTKAPQALMRITSWLGMHFAFVQTYITFFISLNRMAAIVWPRMDDRIWSAVVVLSTVISYVSPLIVTYPYLTEEASFDYSKKIEGYVAHSNSDFPTIYSQLYYFMCVFVVASSCVSIVSMVCLCLRSKRIECVRAERRMLTLALLSFLVEISYFTLLTIVQIDRGGNFEKNARYTIIPFISDLMTFSMPYLILFLNKNVRARLLRPFIRQKEVTPMRRIKVIKRNNAISLISSSAR